MAKKNPTYKLPANWPAAAPMEVRRIADLQAHPRNFRVHPEDQLAAFEAVYEEFGVVRPVVVDEDDVLLAGHGMIEGARRKGFLEYPVIVARGWSEIKKQKFMVADNQLFELGDYDTRLRNLVLADIRKVITSPVQFTALGFGDGTALDKILASAQAPAEFSSFNENIPVEHECPKCGFRGSGAWAPREAVGSKPKEPAKKASPAKKKAASKKPKAKK